MREEAQPVHCDTGACHGNRSTCPGQRVAARACVPVFVELLLENHGGVVGPSAAFAVPTPRCRSAHPVHTLVCALDAGVSTGAGTWSAGPRGSMAGRLCRRRGQRRASERALVSVPPSRRPRVLERLLGRVGCFRGRLERLIVLRLPALYRHAGAAGTGGLMRDPLRRLSAHGPWKDRKE